MRYKTEFTKDYLDWSKVAPISLFDATIEKLEARGRDKMPAHFRNEAKGCAYLILWLDCDREGENICYEVISSCREHFPKDDNIYRKFWMVFG